MGIKTTTGKIRLKIDVPVLNKFDGLVNMSQTKIKQNDIMPSLKTQVSLAINLNF